ncbi:TonB-dependent receptor domain-containing protein [uncultured Bacteroides sp.]|uniref:TonB-dependent receptor domain-containing protein n=1 Tax=uncultured Bacteroides sp. TaxID=162156 RepID=UPI002AA73E7B|nr:TonB-dependent receptor [uncultured Bacteroides sp.]
MKNRPLTFLLMILVSTLTYAQAPTSLSYTVKGMLLDSLTQEGEPYATIKIVKKSIPDKTVKMAVTDTNGKFREKLTDSGTYLITITSIGKKTVIREFTLKSDEKTADLGTLYTSEETNELKGVEIVAQKPLVKVDIDKIEYNIQDDPDSKTNSVLEMLRKVPLVTVDGEDNIKVNGSSSFKVQVNGKPNNMMSNNPTEVLKSMPANSIKYIEVITNPGAKYDAEGVGGILNIVTVGGGFEGYTVTLSGNASNRGAGGSVYGTVKKDKLTVTGNYSYSKNNYPKSYSDLSREDVEADTHLSAHNSNSNNGSFQYGNLEASYEIDTLRLVTLSFGLYGGGNNGNGDGSTELADAANAPIYSYDMNSNNDNSWYSIRGNIDYQRLFKVKDRMLTFSYKINTQPQTSDSYTRYTNAAIPDEWQQRLNLQNQRSDGETNSTEHTFQADYATPLGKLHTVETGVKYIIRNNASDNKFYLANSGSDDYSYSDTRSSKYEHLNDILAAYGGYSFKYKDFSAKAGVRYEHTIQNVKYLVGRGDDFKVNLDDVIPSASLGIKIGKTQNLRGGYNMRIWRPSIYYLNPYRDESNPTSISYGNPELKSEKSHVFNLSYSSFTAKFNLNLSLRYSFNNNGIESYSFLENGILNNTYKNIGKSRNSGLSLYANWNASSMTRLYINADGGYSDYRSPAQGLKNNGWDGFLYGGIQQTFPLDIRLSLNLMGATPQTMLQGRGSGFYDYSMSVNRSFLKKRFTLSAFAGNFLKKYTSSSSHIQGEGFKQTSDSRYSRQRFGVSVSYRLGELKASVKKAARGINNDDVKGGDGGDNGGAK